MLLSHLTSCPLCLADTLGRVAGPAKEALALKGGHADGKCADALFRHPQGIVCAPDGRTFVCDRHSIRCISADQKRQTRTVSTVAGSGEAGWKDGVGEQARFDCPHSIVWYKNRLLVSDCGNHCIRSVDLNTGT